MRKFMQMSSIGLFSILLAACGSSMASEDKGATESSAKSNLTISAERLEYRENPLGLDTQKPRFSWVLSSDKRAQRQTAYQILVSSSAENLSKNKADAWDSGKIASDQTNQIEYQGAALASQQNYHWKVRVWDQDNAVTNWGKDSHWKMGKLKFVDWKAEWIGHKVGHFEGNKYKDLYLPPSPYLRKEFNVSKPIKKAYISATALGLYEMRLNGERVGDDYFTPGWTDYNKRLYYQTYDVTEQLQQGGNAIGGILADGWYAGYVGYGLLVRLDKVRAYYGETPALLAQLDIEYMDGTKQSVFTDESWKASTGPTLEADILMGETYDARLEQDGWDSAGFDDSKWKNANWQTRPGAKIEAYPGTPVEIQEEITALAMTEPEAGKYTFDLGKNFAGLVRLKVKGNKGDKIVLRFGELLNDDGTVMTENLRRARATDTYILKGSNEAEIWTPKFTYHGFQFVEASGFSSKPDISAITGIRMNSTTPETGNIHVEQDVDFGGKTKLVEQLFSNIKTTQYANFFDVPTDCPQRDERLGWTGDAQIYARSSAYVADVASFFTKWNIDLDDSQRWYGPYPNFAPFPYSRKEDHSPAWMDAGVIVPYSMYQAYGDTRMLEKAWDGMERFMQFQADLAGEDLLAPPTGKNWGDWLAIGSNTSKDFISAVYYAYDAKLMAEIARAIGNTQRQQHYLSLFEDIKAAVVGAYMDEQGKLRDHNQTAYAMTIDMGLYPADLKQRGVEYLVELVKANGNKLATGFLGVKHLLPVLTQNGYQELAYTMFTGTEYPSWGFEVVNGATSIWERWNSYSKKEGFNAAMNSFSHYAFGSVVQWMFAQMGGIEPLTPGYSKIAIRPYIDTRAGTKNAKNAQGQNTVLNGVHASYDSIRGTIKTYWKQNDGELIMHVSIPVNTTAEVIIPDSKSGKITENGKALSGVEGVSNVIAQGNNTKLTLGSGDYQFVVSQK